MGHYGRQALSSARFGGCGLIAAALFFDPDMFWRFCLRINCGRDCNFEGRRLGVNLARNRSEINVCEGAR